MDPCDEEGLEGSKRTLSNFFGAKPEVLASYLFGSRATLRAHRGSDLDVAVLFATSSQPALASLERRRLQRIWGEELERLLGLPVDLVDLGTAGVMLAHEVLAGGVKLLERDPALVRAFEARALVAYLDFLPLENRFARAAVMAVREAARW